MGPASRDFLPAQTARPTADGQGSATHFKHRRWAHVALPFVLVPTPQRAARISKALHCPLPAATPCLYDSGSALNRHAGQFQFGPDDTR